MVRRADGLEQPRREDLAAEGARGRLRGPLRRGRRPREEDAGAVQPVLPAARRPPPRLRRARPGRGLPSRARPRSRGRRLRPSAPGARSTPARRSRASPTRSSSSVSARTGPGRCPSRRGSPASCGTPRRPRASDAIALRGRAPSHVDPSYLGETKAPVRYDEGPDAEGMRFTAIVKAVVRGGAVRTTPEGRLEVKRGGRGRPVRLGGDELQRLRQVALPRGPGRRRRGARPLAAATAKSFVALRDAHVADHARLFGRVRLDLGAPAADRPTDERLRAYRHGEDPALVALVFQYGRYLLVASSRPGTQPANLQGIWNEDVRPPWSSNWTMNINSEMNYWPAEVTNLSECHEPMLRMIAELARNGRETARDELRRAGLGRPPQRRPLAADGPGRELGPGRPEVGQLADGRRLALDGPLGALRLHARRRVAAGLRLAAPAGRRGVRARLARPGREGRPRHGAVLLPREHVPGARRERVRHRPLDHVRRRAAAGALHERDRGLDDPRRGRRPAPRDGGRPRPAPAVSSRRAGASCWSGARTSRSPSLTTGTSRTSSACTPGAASRRRRRPRSPRRCGARSSCGATTAPAGRWPGR